MSSNFIMMAALAASLTLPPKEPTLDQIRWLVHCDRPGVALGGPTDGKGSQFSYGATSWTAAWAKFGAYGLYFTGPNGLYLETPVTSADLFGAEDFTIELWFHPLLLTRETATSALFDFNGVAGLAGYFTRDGRICVNKSKGTLLAQSESGVVKQHQWHHLAVVRSNDELSIWINGDKVASANVAGVTFNAYDKLYFAYHAHLENGSFGYYTGYMDEMRVVKGLAVYTENFDVPTEAFVLPPN